MERISKQVYLSGRQVYLSDRQAGQSLVEILVAAFILGMLAIALAGVSVLGTKTAVVSEQRTVAQALANQREELIKITPYLEVGYSDGGTPDGIFPAIETVTRNDQAYEIKMDITLVDDPENGCFDSLPAPCDRGLAEDEADYKKVVISVKYPAADEVAKEVKVSTISVPGQAAALLSLVQCDPTDTSGSCGAGQACCDERCLPWCEPGSCPEGYTCATDGCGCMLESISWQTADATVCHDDFECRSAPNQQCVEGSCVSECASDTDCPSGETCVYGICQAPCTVSGECNDDQICEAGVCRLPGCRDDWYCEPGYSCVDFQCQPKSCFDASYCPPNFECVENTCMPTSCTEGSCPGSWDCVAGRCQPPWCSTAGQTCNAGANCVRNKCQPPTCSYHEQCKGDTVCDSLGVCVVPPACPPACPAALNCVAGECVNPNRAIKPLVLTTECPAPITFPCLPAVGEITASWMPVEGEIYCEPVVSVTACTTGYNPVAEWSDTDGDGIKNCGLPGTIPAINAIPPLLYPIECGSSCPTCPSCPGGESCVEGRCMPDQPCPVGYANHPTIAGKCVEEVAVAPPVACPPGVCSPPSVCSGGECVTAGCLNNDQCKAHGAYLCRNNVCIPRFDRDCSYYNPPARTQYCYGLDCATCSGGAGSACTDPLGKASTVVWAQDRSTGCDFKTCGNAPSVCGDSIVQPGEDCDTGPPLVDTNCPGQCGVGGPCQCPVPVCGNNTKEFGEQCDGTDAVDCPGLCTGSCLCPTSTPPPLCGNGVVEISAGEQCDGSATPAGCSAGENCLSDCTCVVGAPSGTPPVGSCGDLIWNNPWELCDQTASPNGCAVREQCVNCNTCQW